MAAWSLTDTNILSCGGSGDGSGGGSGGGDGGGGNISS